LVSNVGPMKLPAQTSAKLRERCLLRCGATTLSTGLLWTQRCVMNHLVAIMLGPRTF
jgi:hypothetical protein